MAQLKAGSTAGGAAIKTTSDTWGYSTMAFNPAPGTTEGYVKRGFDDKFEIVGTNSGSVISVSGGTVKAFVAGGTPPGAPGAFTTIDTFPFAAPFTTASVVGALIQARSGAVGISSGTQGFVSSSYGYTAPGTASIVATNERFPFTAPFTTASPAGSLASGRYSASGHRSQTNAYVSGGTPTGLINGSVATIEYFPFSAPFTTASPLGSLSATKNGAAGMFSPTDGFATGGQSTPAPSITSIDKFPFAAPFVSAALMGNITQGRYAGGANQSTTEGFTVGGYAPSIPGSSAVVDKFPFAGSAPFTATSIGTLTTATYTQGDISSSTSGYIAAGIPAVSGAIVSFPLSAPFASTTPLGTLSQTRVEGTGNYY